MIRAGRLRHQLTLQEPVTARDSYGADTPTWTDVDTVWGSVEPIAGREFFSAAAERAELTHRVTLRYRPEVLPKWRVRFGSRLFDVEAVVDPEERHRRLELLCREAVA